MILFAVLAGTALLGDLIMGKLKNKKVNPHFSRPSIDVTKVKREWKYVDAKDIKQEDIIGGRGIVQSIAFKAGTGEQDDLSVMITAGLEQSMTVSFHKPDDKIFAFVRKE